MLFLRRSLSDVLLIVHWFIVTNAAGGLNPEYMVGDIVLLNDVSVSLLDSIQAQA